MNGENKVKSAGFFMRRKQALFGTNSQIRVLIHHAFKSFSGKFVKIHNQFLFHKRREV